MASTTNIAQRTAQQIDRLRTTAERLSGYLPNVTAPEIPTRIRYPEMLGLLQLTALADFLDAVADATEPTVTTSSSTAAKVTVAKKTVK